MEVGEFFISLGVDGARGSETLGGFIKQMAALRLTSLTAVGAITEVANVWRNSITQSVNAELALRQFNAQSDVSMTTLKKWEAIGYAAHVSTDLVSGSLGRLSTALLNIRMGAGNRAPFNLLGINPDQSIEGVIAGLIGKAHESAISRTAMTKFLGEMGMAPDMMYLFRANNLNELEVAGRPAILSAKQQADMDRQIVSAQKLSAAWVGVKNALADISTGPLISLFSAMTPALNAFNASISKGSVGYFLSTAFGAPGTAVAKTGKPGGSMAMSGLEGGLLGGAAIGVAGLAIPEVLIGGAVFAALAAMHQRSVNNTTLNANIRHEAGQDTYEHGLATGFNLGVTASELRPSEKGLGGD